MTHRPSPRHRLPSRSVLFLAPALLAVGCERGAPEPSPPAKPANVDTRTYTPPPAPVRAVTVLEKVDVVVGQGKEAKAGDTVRVHYTGRLLDGTKFDSSVDRGDPFEFTLGQGMVIKGWDQGVPGMKVGGKRKLTIPSDLAYGKAGSPPKIPADAPLEFDVELVEVK